MVCVCGPTTQADARVSYPESTLEMAVPQKSMPCQVWSQHKSTFEGLQLCSFHTCWRHTIQQILNIRTLNQQECCMVRLLTSKATEGCRFNSWRLRHSCRWAEWFVWRWLMLFGSPTQGRRLSNSQIFLTIATQQVKAVP